MTTSLENTPYVINLSDPRADLETVGGKGASLARLVENGLPVPDGFHITTIAYHRFVEENKLEDRIQAALQSVEIDRPVSLENAAKVITDLFTGAQTPPEIAGDIAQAYAELSGRDPVVAVRSSATAEDLPEASFAGQQETFLNVSGIEFVLQAVKRCWASLWTARAIGYRARHRIGIEGLGLAVVVQILVPAEAAGILFTANPINGRRDQAMISAAWGLGEAVVGGLVTADTIILDKNNGEIIERQIADKRIMTARVNGGTKDQPVPDELRTAPALDEQPALELLKLGVRIEDIYGMPMDIEWALADGEIAIVQARPITALPEEKAKPPTEWPMPDPDGPYMRGSIADFMPDPLTPLFRTIAVPAINQAMKRTMAETIGGQASLLDNYLTTINNYAYLYVKIKFNDWMWILFKMVPALPRLLRNAVKHWQSTARPRYLEAISPWSEMTEGEMTATELLRGVEELTAAMGDYLTALQVDTLGAAAGSEGLFTAIYDKLIKQPDGPPAPRFLLGSDSLPIQAEKSLYDLAQWCRQQSDLSNYLLEMPTNQIAERLTNDEPQEEIEIWVEWANRFQGYMEKYGHCIYDLDFSKSLPMDQPQPQIETLKLYLSGGGANPHIRQQESLKKRQEAIAHIVQRISPLKLRIFRWALGIAQTFTKVREDSIFDIGLGYPDIRRMLAELGQRFAKAGAIEKPADIYWLNQEEVARGVEALDRNQLLEDLSKDINKRKKQWQAEKRATPPQQLPPKSRVMGIKTDAFLAVSEEDQSELTLKGVAASSGKVTGVARVLHGQDDFDLMQPGDILVAEITTPAWTPLFAMAVGVVTDIGGPLSHGSIVAREYGIPAVLGTGVATQRIQNGQTITVDGDAGTISLV